MNRALWVVLWLGILAVGEGVWAQYRPSREEVKAVRANFLGSHDSFGRIIFDPFYISLTNAERKDWRDLKKKAGLTHFVLAPKISYPGFAIPGRDLRRDPDAFRFYVEEILNDGFVPIIFLSSGDRGSEDDIDEHYEDILNTLRDLVPYMILVPAWEPIVGNWSSRDLSRAMLKIHDVLGSSAIMYIHFSETRPTGSSNPVERDDPWQGDEIGFWNSHGGQYASGILYQTPKGRVLLNPTNAGATRDSYGRCYDSDDIFEDDWRCRLKEVADRLIFGYRGWRPIEFVLFETVAYDYVHGNFLDHQRISHINNEARKLGVKWFGNGGDVDTGGGGGVVPSGRSVLTPSKSLRPNMSLQSENNTFSLVYQSDGNLVLYENGNPVWATSTFEPGSLDMQTDGNLVMYNTGGHPIWASNTNAGGSYLKLENDGDIVIRAADGTEVKSLRGAEKPPPQAVILAPGKSLKPNQYLKSHNGQYTLYYQGDGNLVLYSSVGPLWATSTLEAGETVMQGDGNLVIYNTKGKPLWASGTHGNTGAYLVVHDDGHLVIYSAVGTELKKLR